MRVFWLLAVMFGLAGTATLLVVGGGRPELVANAKDAPKADKKKAEEKKDEGKKAEEKKEEKKPVAKTVSPDEELLRRAALPTDSKALVAFLKKRILPEKDRPEVERLVRQLGSSDYRLREKANHLLLERGVAALEGLRTVPRSTVDGETARRIERTVQLIREKDIGPGVLATVVRVAGLRYSSELIETFLGYLPFADNEAVLDELRYALTRHAVKDGKADPLLLAALSDRAAIRRATAGEALVRAAYAEYKATVRKLLNDDDPLVRYRVARALALAHERDAIPVLIDAMPELPLNTAWQAEDFLLKLTTASAAPAVAMGNDKSTQLKCRASWREWWKKHGAKCDLTKLEDTPRMLGRTLVILLDQKCVVDLAPDNEVVWEVKDLATPLDAQWLGEDRVLLAEYHASMVTERNARGEILWKKAIGNVARGVGGSGPQVAQRLANGNTFIGTAFQLLEFDKDGEEVVNISLGDDGQQKIMKSMKLDNGEFACMLADARIVRFDARGNELHSFSIQLGTGIRLFGGRIHMLGNGRVIVPHNAQDKVAEYDRLGKIIWEVPFEAPVAATRLPNGNTLITSMNPAVGAVEVDRAGIQVWSYHVDDSRTTRAIRR